MTTAAVYADWKAKGLCLRCGHSRGKSPFKSVCGFCGFYLRLRQRQTQKSKPWKKGGPGRPPLTGFPQSA